MPAPVDVQIKRDAEWARQFRNAPTSAAGRVRRDEALADDAKLAWQEAEKARELNLQANKGARDLMLGRERVRQADERLGLTEMGMQQRQNNFEATERRIIDRDAFREEMDLRRLKLNELNEQRRMRKEIADAANAEKVLDQTTRAEQEVNDHVFNGILPGTKDFAERALRVIAQNPMIDPKARASILGSAKIIGEDEEFDTAWNKLTPEQQKRATVVDDPKGWRISVAPAKASGEAPDIGKLRDEYLRISRDFNAIKDDNSPETQFDRSLLRTERARLRGLIEGAEKPAQSTAAPTAPALVPRRSSNGEVWLYDPETKQPVRRQGENE
jgi:hypothetical protein